MNVVRLKLKKGGGAGPFVAQVGTVTRVVVELPKFEAQVLDELGGPVPDVAVNVRFSNGQIHQQQTDANGTVSISHRFPEEVVSMTLPELDGALWDLDPLEGEGDP